MEERRYVFGTTVLIFEVVGMLPNVDAENRDPATGKRTVLIWRSLDLQLPIRPKSQPRPSASKRPACCLRKLLLEFAETAKLRIDVFCQFAARRVTAAL